MWKWLKMKYFIGHEKYYVDVSKLREILDGVGIDYKLGFDDRTEPVLLIRAKEDKPGES